LSAALSLTLLSSSLSLYSRLGSSQFTKITLQLISITIIE